jgi:3'(2'), 5'-bisphosphate nucleotidase
MELVSLLPHVIAAAEAASREILDVYYSGDFEVEAKSDASPLTLADKRAHIAIESALKDLHLPMLSEEGKSIPYGTRKTWDYFWLVDPLDGTKEFMKQNGEFTVNIALIHQGMPILGVVAVPVTGDVFYATQNGGAFVKKNGTTIPLGQRSKPDLQLPGLRIVASRSHMDADTQAFVNKLDNPILVSKGSSLKFMLLAEGQADLYPRFAPTMEWDTAAAHAIITEAGLNVYQANTNSPLLYNKENLLNPSFIVQ